MPRKKTITWVLIGDGAKAQLYDIVSVVPMRLKAIPGGRFRGTHAGAQAMPNGKLSKTSEGAGAARQGAGPRNDAHRRQEDKFVTRVTAVVNTAAGAKKFDQIIVVAPPRALATFRKKYDATAKLKIKREIRGDWTKLNPAEIQDHLVSHLNE